MAMTLPNSVRKPLIGAFGAQQSGPVPFWLMRQAGRYLPEYRALRAEARDFLQFCYTPALTVEAALQPLRRFGMDAAILFSDILVIPDALGCGVRFVEGRGPQLDPVRSAADLERLRPSAAEEHLMPVFRSLELLKRKLAAETALIGFAGAPWTVALYMVEGCGGGENEAVRSMAYAKPQVFSRLMDMLVDVTTLYLVRQVEHGADVVQLFDTWAGVLSETQFRRWVIAPTAEIVRRLRERHPHVPVIGFPRGAGALYVDYARETGVDGVGLDAGVPLDWVRDELQPRVLVQGNLDNVALVAGGAVLEQEAKRVLSELGSGRFVFNLGHGVLPHTPPEHVARLAEIVKAHGTMGAG